MNMILSIFVLILHLIHLTICLPLGHPLSLSARTSDPSHAPFTASTSKVAHRPHGTSGDTVRWILETSNGTSTPAALAAADSQGNVYLAAPFAENFLTPRTLRSRYSWLQQHQIPRAASGWLKVSGQSSTECNAEMAFPPQ